MFHSYQQNSESSKNLRSSENSMAWMSWDVSGKSWFIQKCGNWNCYLRVQFLHFTKIQLSFFLEKQFYKCTKLSYSKRYTAWMSSKMWKKPGCPALRKFAKLIWSSNEDVFIVIRLATKKKKTLPRHRESFLM